MSKDFVRLYKNIGKTTTSSFPNDDKSLPERLKVLNVLGYETGFRDNLVQPHRYHGKSARRRRENLTSTGKLILPRIKSTLQSFDKDQLLLSTSLNARILKSEITTMSPVKYVPSKAIIRDLNTIDKGFSRNKWSLVERQKLIDIYCSMKEPEHPDLKMAFYVAVASRFLVFHPVRHKDEVVQKIITMKRNKSMKLPGEEKYWRDIRSTSIPTTTAERL
jgi:hypothetical protein